MSIVGGWVDWAQRIPGLRQDKAYSEDNDGLGIAWHSQEGYGLHVMVNIHQRPSPPSFMFWLAMDGTLYQFSPVTASVWCSGNREANTRLWPVELEGNSLNPINDEQMRTALRLMAEWSAHSGRPVVRADEATRTQWEHREVAVAWNPSANAGPTSCPSERYAPLWAALEDEMTPEQLARLERLERIVAGNGILIIENGAEKTLTGEDALRFANQQGWSAFLGLYLARYKDPNATWQTPAGSGTHTHQAEVTLK